jgi:hypothetical protein
MGITCQFHSLNLLYGLTSSCNLESLYRAGRGSGNTSITCLGDVGTHTDMGKVAGAFS